MTAMPATMLLEELLSPLSAARPCGENLEYDPDFVVLHAAVAPRETAQYGDFVEAAEAINWVDIERRCRALMLRTRDLRLAVLLVRCRVRLGGATGLVDGLLLVRGLLERYGAELHPLMVVEGETDPIMRANALASLADQAGLLADVRDLTLGKSAGLTLGVRNIERAFTMPTSKDAISPEIARRFIDDLVVAKDKTVAAFRRALDELRGIETWSMSALANEAPSLDALTALLEPYAEKGIPGGLADPVGVDVGEPEEVAQSLTVQKTDAVDAVVTSVMTRRSALALIVESREWFELHEPSSPVSVLLRQAERLVGKRYADLVTAIPADLLAQWESTA
jgi:type VI secretion system protein ImpA